MPRLKMPKTVFDSLQADMRLIAKKMDAMWRTRTEPYTVAQCWQLLHEVNAQRSYADNHPRWDSKTRYLPQSHVGGQTFINELYEHVNDTHIASAFRAMDLLPTEAERNADEANAPAAA